MLLMLYHSRLVHIQDLIPLVFEVIGIVTEASTQADYLYKLSSYKCVYVYVYTYIFPNCSGLENIPSRLVVNGNLALQRQLDKICAEL